MPCNIPVNELDPESTDIASVADKIVKSQVTCTPEEKMKLKELKAGLDKVIAEAQTSLKKVQKELEKLTGTTLGITSAPTSG